MDKTDRNTEAIDCLILRLIHKISQLSPTNCDYPQEKGLPDAPLCAHHILYRRLLAQRPIVQASIPCRALRPEGMDLQKEVSKWP